MEVVRKIVDAKKLMSVIPLPETMRNRRVEVIVLPAEEQKVSENLKKSGNIESLVDSLVGVIRDTGKSTLFRPPLTAAFSLKFFCSL